MGKQSYQDAVLKTVMWWSDKAFKSIMNQNNGDDSNNGGIAFMLMNMVSMKAQNDVTPDKIKKFEDKLTSLLMAEENKEYRHTTLHVDYHPDIMLSEACKFAGIDVACLPCKTTTWIDKNNKATASYQYRGPLTEI